MKKETLDKIVERLDRLSVQEQRQLLLRLASQKELMEGVFNALRDGVILFNSLGAATFTNEAACHIYACTRADLMQRPFEQLVGGTCTWRELWGSGIGITRDLQVDYPEPRHYNFFMTPLSGGEEYLLLIHDDTELRAREEENAEAEQMNMLSFLSSAVAHELGNPVNSLGLNLQVLRRKLRKLSAETEEQLAPLIERSLNQTKRLDELIRHFLQSMRPCSSQTRESVNVNELLKQVISSLEAELASRSLAVIENYSPDIPLLKADPSRLYQVFYNLIRNACQSIPGAHSIENEGRLMIETSYSDADVYVRITDNGTGISHEVMGRIYEPFQTTKAQGNGLGLLIVRRILKEHRGNLAIASKKGVGTTVTVVLPRSERITRLLPH